MKKLLMLGAVAAAAYGAMKFFGSTKNEDDSIYGASAYTPAPESQPTDAQYPYGTQPPANQPQQQF